MHPERCDIRRVAIPQTAPPPTIDEEEDPALDALLAYRDEKAAAAVYGSPDITVESQRSERRPSLLVLGRNYDLRNGDILGRQGTVAADIFSSDKAVSRKHAMVSFGNGRASVTNLASTGNPLKVNGKILGHMDQAALHAGLNTLVFGTKGFTVTLEMP